MIDQFFKLITLIHVFGAVCCQIPHYLLPTGVSLTFEEIKYHTVYVKRPDSNICKRGRQKKTKKTDNIHGVRRDHRSTIGIADEHIFPAVKPAYALLKSTTV